MRHGLAGLRRNNAEQNLLPGVPWRLGGNAGARLFRGRVESGGFTVNLWVGGPRPQGHTKAGGWCSGEGGTL